MPSHKHDHVGCPLMIFVDDHGWPELLGGKIHLIRKQGKEIKLFSITLYTITSILKTLVIFAIWLAVISSDIFSLIALFLCSKRHLFSGNVESSKIKANNKFLWKKSKNSRSACYIYAMTLLSQTLKIEFDLEKKQNIHVQSYHTVIFLSWKYLSNIRFKS